MRGFALRSGRGIIQSYYGGDAIIALEDRLKSQDKSTEDLQQKDDKTSCSAVRKTCARYPAPLYSTTMIITRDKKNIITAQLPAVTRQDNHNGHFADSRQLRPSASYQCTLSSSFLAHILSPFLAGTVCLSCVLGRFPQTARARTAWLQLFEPEDSRVHQSHGLGASAGRRGTWNPACLDARRVDRTGRPATVGDPDGSSL